MRCQLSEFFCRAFRLTQNFLFFLSIWISPQVFPFESNILESDFQQNPPELRWFKFQTKHFDIIFPRGLDSTALRVGNVLEKIYPAVCRSLEVTPPRIPLVLQNQSVGSNGFVTLAPRRSEWYITPATDPLLTNTEWLKTLAIHELRHIVQFEKSRKGFNKVLETLFGEVGQALGVGLTMPPWFLEGDGVGIETALTLGGRGRLPLFERDLRTLLLSGKKFTYDKAHLGSYEDYLPSHYVYGYFLTSQMRNENGDLFLSSLINYSSINSWNPLTFYNAFEFLTDQKFENFFSRTMDELFYKWKEKVDLLNPTPYILKNPTKKMGWTNYYFPQVTKEGKIFALKKGLSFIDQFVIIDGANDEIIYYPGILENKHPYKLRNNKVAFFELQFDPRWGYRNFTRLKVLDINTKKIVLNLPNQKGRIASLSHEGEKIAFVEWNEEQTQILKIINLEGQQLKKLEIPSTDVITSLDWINPNKIVVVMKGQEDLKSINMIDLETGDFFVLLEGSQENIGNISFEDGNIFYESPISGIDNIFILTDNGPRQITNALFGSYSPDIHNNKLIYNDYTVTGMNIVQKSVDALEEQNSSDSFFPVFLKISDFEKKVEREKLVIPDLNIKAEKYSLLKNSINFHSLIFLAPPLSNTISITGLSRDVMNKFSLNVGTEYNLNEQTMTGIMSSTWSHYYPVLGLAVSFGGRRQKTTDSEDERKWEEGILETGFTIPWKYINGRFLQNFSLGAFSKLIKVTNNDSGDRTTLQDGELFSPVLDVKYSFFQRMSFRDINPPLGIHIDGHFEIANEITGDDFSGQISSLDSRYYLPGFLMHHTFYHQFSYEIQRDDTYRFASRIFYPRGTRSFFLREFSKYSGNYSLPVAYPDWSMSRYLYFKRIILNLFYDELNGNFNQYHYRAASAGWEALFEINLLRVFVPVNFGVRGSYVLDGEDKKNNYELFLTSVLGTF